MITDVVLLGNKIAPGLGDWYMARTGYESQMTDEPEDPERPHNLWAPLPGDHGARERFDRQARGSSAQWWLTRNRGWVALAGLAVVGTAVALAICLAGG